MLYKLFKFLSWFIIMKINDKNISAYGISRDHINKEGYLLKKEHTNRNYQKRWFVLKGNLLFYFEKKNDKDPVGLIILEGCTPELADSEDHHLFKIVFAGYEKHEYLLAADTLEDLESWMKNISRASHDYVRLMVDELQKQLSDIEATVSDGVQSQSDSLSKQARINPFNKRESVTSYSDLWKTPEPSSTVVCRSPSRNQNMYLLTKNIPHRAAPPPPVRSKTEANNVGKDSSCTNNSQSYMSRKRKTFSELHGEYGAKILKDHQKYSEMHTTSHCKCSGGDEFCGHCEGGKRKILKINDTISDKFHNECSLENKCEQKDSGPKVENLIEF